MKKRINCFTVGCDNCESGIMVKKNFWGDKLYICSVYQKPHKIISGKNCGKFRCNKYDFRDIVCKDCRRGL